MAFIISILEQGMIYGIMALGMYITYRILDFPDMTVDGCFPFGVVAAIVMIRGGVLPILTLPICFVLGCIIGMITGIINVYGRVRDLLAGIIMMTGLYSVNLVIAGRANLPMYEYYNIFDNTFLDSIIPESIKKFQTLIVLIIIVIVVKLILDWYMRTKSGYMLRAVGDNDTLVTSMGIDKGKVRIMGLAIANGLVALAGSIFAQQQGYFDISMGTGTAVIGLASVIIGTNIIKNPKIIGVTSTVIIGAIIYRACVAVAIKAGLNPNLMKLVSAALLLIILIITMERKKDVREGR